MRYPPGHKEETRARIVQAAADLFRTRGYEGVGVQDIMKEAGLTHGGFYGHFKSKQHLFQSVMGLEADFLRRMRARTGTTGKALRDEAKDICTGYLEPAHMDAISKGCPMASLAVDAARADTKTRKEFAKGLSDLEREFARGLTSSGEPDSRALAAIALAVGGFILGRASGDKDLQTAIMSASRDEIANLLDRSKP
ncbi:TetR/AcrR family transcriptional regulator [Pyruvatibacter sp.]